MTTLLLEKIDTLATFDAQRQVLKNGWVLIRDDVIEAVGAGDSATIQADWRINLAGHVVLPGLINTHHHMFQSLLRNVPLLQDVSLFEWLDVLYVLMGEVTDEDQYVAASVNHAELLLSGCTTTVDHNYLKVNDMKFDTSIQAAQDMGIRFHLARGSATLSQSKGGSLPDHIVEEEEDVLVDLERLIKRYHDPKPRAMVRLVNAPGAPFSVTPWLMRQSIDLARRHGICNHTHLAQSAADDAYMRHLYGKASVYVAEDWGWVGEDVWYAHATVLGDDEIDVLAATGTSVAHCPNSNMYTAAGCCRVPYLLQKGVTVGLGVDGSAANNASNLLAEARNALLLQRMHFGADALAPTQALELATLGSARLLRRDDLGVIAAGMAADIIAINLNKIAFAGGLHDPVAALILCAAGQVDWTIVNGRIRVEAGQLVGVDLPALIKQQNELAAALIERAEKRAQRSLRTPIWRRAFPYDPMAT
jgi:cytosine/adenosine deaminase-related metal-dependent hydrolase